MPLITNGLIRHAGRSRDAPLDSDLLTGLLRPKAYPHPVDRVELVETHISWVLLTGEFAYKVKKPVELGFLDFRELDRRRFFCEQEVRLNRFWAPELYLDVVPIGMRDGQPRVGGNGPAVEYAVRMRQFDQALRLDHQLEAGRLSGHDMLELAAEIAARHWAADRAGPAGRLVLATKRLMWDNFDDLIGEVAHERIVALHRWTKESLGLHEAKLKERCGKGFYRECHGDLHLGNIVRLAGGIKAFDCIEFSEELRQTDVVADYGFLVMDLVARGRTDLAFAFLNRYLEISGDYDGVTLLPLYVVYRCLVRAKVAAIRRRERSPAESRDEDTATLDHYFELAQAWTEPRRPVLAVMNGLSGSGKTWLSTRLVTAMPALRMRSDLERKRLFGLEEAADSHSGIASGIYDRKAGRAVYDPMFDGARSMLAAGFDVILDAAFLNVESRGRAKCLAADCGADFVIVQATAPQEILEERLRQRAAVGKEASEADLAVLRYQLDTSEQLTADEARSAVIVNTDSDVDPSSVVLEIRRRTGAAELAVPG
jgi:hypothetical protein